MKVMTMRKILILIELRVTGLLTLMLTLHLSDEVIIRCHLVIGDATESLNHPAWARDRARLGSQSSGSDNQCIVDIANSLSDISCLFLPLSMENKWRKFCHVKKIKN